MIFSARVSQPHFSEHALTPTPCPLCYATAILNTSLGTLYLRVYQENDQFRIYLTSNEPLSARLDNVAYGLIFRYNLVREDGLFRLSPIEEFCERFLQPSPTDPPGQTEEHQNIIRREIPQIAKALLTHPIWTELLAIVHIWAVAHATYLALPGLPMRQQAARVYCAPLPKEVLARLLCHDNKAMRLAAISVIQGTRAQSSTR